MKNTFLLIVALLLSAINSNGQGTKLGEKLETALKDKDIAVVNDVRTKNVSKNDGSKSWYKYRQVRVNITNAAARSRFEGAVKDGFNADRDNNNLVIMTSSEFKGAPKVKYDIKYAENKTLVLGNDSTKSLTLVVVDDPNGTRHLAAVESKDEDSALDAVAYIIEYKADKDGVLPSEQFVNHLELSIANGDDSDIIKRLKFFRDKYALDSTLQAPVSAAGIAANAICQNPVWGDITKAQNIILDMMKYATDTKHVEALEKISQELSDALEKLSATTKRIIGPFSDKLVIIDGMESSWDKIDHSNIKSMESLVGDIAVEKYGEKARNGVIIITTKK